MHLLFANPLVAAAQIGAGASIVVALIKALADPETPWPIKLVFDARKSPRRSRRAKMPGPKTLAACEALSHSKPMPNPVVEFSRCDTRRDMLLIVGAFPLLAYIPFLINGLLLLHGWQSLRPAPFLGRAAALVGVYAILSYPLIYAASFIASARLKEKQTVQALKWSAAPLIFLLGFGAIWYFGLQAVHRAQMPNGPPVHYGVPFQLPKR